MTEPDELPPILGIPPHLSDQVWARLVARIDDPTYDVDDLLATVPSLNGDSGADDGAGEGGHGEGIDTWTDTSGLPVDDWTPPASGYDEGPLGADEPGHSGHD